MVAKRRRHEIGWAIGGLAVVLVVGCSGAPNLDEAAAGRSPAEIRESVAGHLDWGQRLTPAELDAVAGFVASVAGTGGRASPAPPGGGLLVWRASGCGSCHELAAAQ